MKLNNKGFAISSIMYIILVLAVILISLILVTLSSGKLILDKLKSEVLNNIYEEYPLTYRQTLNILKDEAIAYASSNNIKTDSIKISEFETSVDDTIISGYKLSDRYLTMVSNESAYDVYLGKEEVVNDISEPIENLIDIVDYKIYGNSVQDGVPTPDAPIEIESVGEKTKNIISESKLSGGSNSGIVVTKNGQTMIVNGTSTQSGTSVRIADDIILDPGTYVFASEGSDDVVVAWRKYTETGTQSLLGGAGHSSRMLTLTEQTRVYVNIYTAEEGKTYNNDQIRIMIAKSDELIDYEPYGYKIPVKLSNDTEEITTNIYIDEPLRKIGDYSDYIGLKNGKVVRNIKEYIFTGQEKFGRYFHDSEGLSFYIDVSDSIIGYNTSLCTHYKNIKAAWQSKDYGKIGIYSDHLSSMVRYFRPPKVEVETVDQFKEWLTTKYSDNDPTKLYYIIATPVEQQEELSKINITMGVTQISIDTDIAPSNYEFTVVEKIIEI